jgi:zinc/manganese transport system substrate-binding protein
MRPLPLLGSFAVLLWAGAAVAAAPIPVVAAENFYGDVARQIGGPDVSVTSILSNPAADPHLFEAGASTARALADARLVIENGLDYDPWVDKLLQASGGHDRTVVTVAALVGRKSGDNPHIWYDPATMPAVARALSERLAQIDPAHRDEYEARLNSFLASLKPIGRKIAALRARLAGAPVTATEPVFGYMLTALGMEVRNQGFQRATMNSTEPSASDVAALENDLRNRRVKLFIYNAQASSPLTRHMLALAREARIPVIAVTETEPAGETYQAWIGHELDALARALPE